MTQNTAERPEPDLPVPVPGAKGGDAPPTFDEWRARAVRAVLLVVAVSGLPAWGAVLWGAVGAGQLTPLLWIYLFVYGAFLLLAFAPRVDYHVRTWGLLILGYINGCASMARLGLEGSGRLYFLLMPVFTTVLVGARAGLATTFLTLATYVFFAAQAKATAAAAWVEAGTALATFVLCAVVLLARFSRFQLQTLNRERQARRDLEVAQAQLEAYSDTLEAKVQERTAALAEAKRQAEAVSRRLEQELLFAGRIQASFMGSELPKIPSWQCAAALVPARETSGDFYNVFPLSAARSDGEEAGEKRDHGVPAERDAVNDRYGILIADVVDKGVGAALFMALCWALLHTYARRHPNDPARVLAAVNRRILRDTHGGQFVTVFYGVLDADTGTLRYANAGHPPAFCLREGRLRALGKTGIPLGVLEDAQWQQETVSLEPGDLCLLYTDGITEAQNRYGAFFDVPRLATVLRRNAGRPAEQVREALLAEVTRFVGDVAQADDITLLVLANEGKWGQQREHRRRSMVDAPAVAAPQAA